MIRKGVRAGRVAVGMAGSAVVVREATWGRGFVSGVLG